MKVSRTRLKRALVGLGLAVMVLGIGSRPVNAWAIDDSVDSWQVNYTVDTSGVLHVSETLVWRFGSTSGRHGIDRVLVTREPWGSTDQDAVYTISNIGVTSPDASAEFATSTMGSGRDRQLRIRIGSADRVVTAPTATYTLTYDVKGAMRTTPGQYDELYWDAIGDNTPVVGNIKIAVTVPGGVQDVTCYSGPATTNHPCTSATVGQDGKATYTVASKNAGDIVTIGAKIGSGLVKNNQPDLVQRADKASRTTMAVAGGATGGTALATIGVVGVMAARNRRDERFLGVAPGTVESSGQGIGPDNHPTIPVAFTPPKIPVAAAGLIDDGAVDVRDMTGALLSLAVRGAIQLRQDDASPRSWVFGGSSAQTIYARLVRTDVDVSPHEARLLSNIFPGLHIGTEKALTGRSALYTAYQDLRKDVRADVEEAKWYIRMPSSTITSSTAGATAAIGSVLRAVFLVVWGLFVFASVGIGGLVSAISSGSVGWLIWVGPLIVIIIGFLVYRGLTARGQRSAIGRAYADQVAGFREYLTRAEADQLKFEEGQDIFSQYLPWAVIYGVADRWTKLCGQLVQEGRLDIQPTWYYGDYNMFNIYVFTNSLNSINQASLPAQPSGGGWSSSGTGFGGGSSFGGGGGFSGGGGGGGGASSW